MPKLRMPLTGLPLWPVQCYFIFVVCTRRLHVADWQWVMQSDCRGYSVLLPSFLLLDAYNGFRRVADPAACHVRVARIRGKTVAQVCSLFLMDLDGAVYFCSGSRSHGLCSCRYASYASTNFSGIQCILFIAGTKINRILQHSLLKMLQSVC